ncbi:hypothetical protein TSOC_010085 [Tetrabaena socialis]|uniref:Protein kinase domain-containing protein n=1 Tax=Tetrabaena socialis TaxID=47790 RepID=A0A2J7ZU81_9CHLO|nr:hypothetical protein TSOC_010085 [Tetrabaena socialis]|eukprot:PNH03819.1 hypothetical protein TSOC_010085 [Tetrabaena socialis]
MPHTSMAMQLKRDLQAKKAKDQVSAVSSEDLKKDLQLKRLLGRGGFAAVFLGVYKGEEVAVKILLPEHMQAGGAQVSLMLREGQYMSRCTHSNIVKCHAVCQLPANFPGMEVMGHTGSTWALVLEYIPVSAGGWGGSMAGMMMKQMSQTRRAYSNYQAYCWVRDVAEALSYLHNAPRPVMHRDVKADNVLLTIDPDNGRPTAKLMDFGLMAFYTCAAPPPPIPSAAAHPP